MTTPVSALVCVVAYETSVADSRTLQTLSKAEGVKGIRLVVRDNSSKQALLAADLEHLNMPIEAARVDWDGQNRALSMIYNDVADEIGSNEWLVLLDDDTDLPVDFFQKLAMVDETSFDCDLAVPIVRCGERIVSPGRYRFVKGKHLKKVRPGILPSFDSVAITSGMAIRRRYIESYPRPFDEGLSFYGIDTRFCLDFRKRRPFLFVTDCVLSHDSALWRDDRPDVRRVRLKMLRKASYRIHRGNRFALIALAIVNTAASVRNALYFRDLRYLF